MKTSAEYMRERRRKIKLGLITPAAPNERTRSKQKHYQRDYQRRARRTVLDHYGSRCRCCGEEHVEFLAVDHVNNDGAKHRREGGRNIYTWLIAHNFPDGFQILCHNCNFAKSFYDGCPHLKVLTK